MPASQKSASGGRNFMELSDRKPSNRLPSQVFKALIARFSVMKNKSNRSQAGFPAVKPVNGYKSVN